MKWKALAAAVMALAASASARAGQPLDWHLASVTSDIAWAYSSPADPKTEVYISIRFPGPQRLGDGGSFSGVMTTFALDCPGNRVRMSNVAHFEQDGSQIDSVPSDLDWRPLTPNAQTYDINAMMADVCAGRPGKSLDHISTDAEGAQKWLAGRMAKNTPAP